MQELLSNTTDCAFECRSMLLGVLNKHLHDQGLLRHVSSLEPNSRTFAGLSVKDLVNIIRTIDSPSPCKGGRSCTLGGLLKPKLNDIVKESGLPGIQLDTGDGAERRKKNQKKKDQPTSYSSLIYISYLAR